MLVPRRIPISILVVIQILRPGDGRRESLPAWPEEPHQREGCSTDEERHGNVETGHYGNHPKVLHSKSQAAWVNQTPPAASTSALNCRMMCRRSPSVGSAHFTYPPPRSMP